jgi:hypothetical protein
MRNAIHHISTLVMMAATLLVALTAIAHWSTGNLAAAIAFAGWSATLMVFWIMSELTWNRGPAERKGDANDG